MIKARISIFLTAKKCKIVSGILILLLPLAAGATTDPAPLTRSYISWYAEEAVHQMVEHKIPASVILAQAIFESRCGNSALARKSNNHFGIKCHIEWGGDTVTKTDDTLNECFRKYRSVEESYADHSLFLKSRGRYAHLFELDVTDYKGWCRGLKAAGYATFAGYADELIRIIEENRLYILDSYEKMETRVHTASPKELRKSSFHTNYFNLKDFAGSGALFADEQNTLIRSLDLVTEPHTDMRDEIADK